MGERPRTVAEEIREATREAHAATKDLRAAVREAREAEASIRAAIPKSIEAEVAAALKDELAKLGKATSEAMDNAVARVTREFDGLKNILTHGHRSPNQTGKHGDLVDVKLRGVVTKEILRLVKEAEKIGDPKRLLRDVAKVAEEEADGG